MIFAFLNHEKANNDSILFKNDNKDKYYHGIIIINYLMNRIIL